MLESKLRSAFYRDTYTDNVFQLKISRGNYVTVVLLNHIPYVTVLAPIATSTGRHVILPRVTCEGSCDNLRSDTI